MKKSLTYTLALVTSLSCVMPVCAEDSAKYVEKTIEPAHELSVHGVTLAIQGGEGSYRVDPSDKDAITAGPNQRVYFNGNPKMMVPAKKYAVIKGPNDIVLKDEVAK